MGKVAALPEIRNVAKRFFMMYSGWLDGRQRIRRRVIWDR